MFNDLEYLENYNELPRLPVPKLEDTITRFLATVKPLVSPAEYEACKQKAYELLDPEISIGQTLQSRLLARYNDPNVISWIEELWNDVAYLQNRQSLCFNVNYNFGFRQIVSKNLPVSQELVSAAIINSICNYRNLIISKNLETDKVRTTSLCMSQFKYQFAACRYPSLPYDYTKVFPLDQSYHIIIASKGNYYKYMPYILDPVTNSPLFTENGLVVKSIDQINSDLLQLTASNSSLVPPKHTNIGILTTLERDDWHAARSCLVQLSEKNKNSLLEIESSSFLLALDDNEPSTYTELSNACYSSDGFNRFYDKCFQILVFKNGRYGFNGEHSLTDGTTDVRLSRYFVKDVENFFASPQSTISVPTTPPSSDSQQTDNFIKPLEFEYNNTLNRFIRRAWSFFDQNTFRQEVSATRFAKFGKNSVKKLKVSPDAFAQMAIQLAYYKLFDQFVATYESASTRSFAHGRTETSRSISEFSVKFCKAMLGEDDVQLAGGEVSTAEIASLLRSAISAQSEYTRSASIANGVDRHFLGLRHCIQDDEEWPALFSDVAFKKSSYWQLSTSQISEEFMDAYGWGQVVYDGFGIAYMVLNDCYHFNVASSHLGSKRLGDAIAESLEEMYDLLESVSSPQPAAAA
ncbi:Carnitine O-acetyltransferase, mitochondrial, partial [Smittium culicis]